MKKILSIIIMCLLTVAVSAKNISYIDEKGGYYRIYDEYGKLWHEMSTNKGKLISYSSEFIMLKDKSGYYYWYRNDGKKMKTLSTNEVGTVIKVTDDGFVSKKGGYIIIWNHLGTIEKIISGE